MYAYATGIRLHIGSYIIYCGSKYLGLGLKTLFKSVYYIGATVGARVSYIGRV